MALIVRKLHFAISKTCLKAFSLKCLSQAFYPGKVNVIFVAQQEVIIADSQYSNLFYFLNHFFQYMRSGVKEANNRKLGVPGFSYIL